MSKNPDIYNIFTDPPKIQSFAPPRVAGRGGWRRRVGLGNFSTRLTPELSTTGRSTGHLRSAELDWVGVRRAKKAPGANHSTRPGPLGVSRVGILWIFGAMRTNRNSQTPEILEILIFPAPDVSRTRVHLIGQALSRTSRWRAHVLRRPTMVPARREK